MGKFFKRIVLLLVLVGSFYFLFGIFVVSPVSILSEGSTILYFRLGLNTSFLSSSGAALPDESDDVVSSLEKVVGTVKLGKKVKDRQIAIFPYSQAMDRLARGKGLFRTEHAN